MQEIGCHISANKYNELVDIALSLNTNTMQFFSRSNRGGPIKKLDEKDIELFNKKLKDNNFKNILIHGPFIINACSNKENIRSMSPIVMKEDIARVEIFDVNTFYVFHPGSHMEQGSEFGCRHIAGMLNNVITEEQKTTILLETMAGKGTEVGRSFEELADIIKMVDIDEKVGVCLDTCHVWDSGYDLGKLDEVLKKFDNIIGLNRLKYIHLNNSQNEIGSHKDRHANINNGRISLEIIESILNHPVLIPIPKILETPVENYEIDLKTIKKLIK